MDKKTKINTSVSLLLQLVMIISGFIIPRQILTVFGSEVNGLVGSITQFLNYISLIEGGVGSVLMTALYQPLNEKNKLQISRVIVAAHQFFKKLAKIFLIYLIIVSVAYPLLVKTSYNYGYLCSLTLILGVTLFVQYYFSITWKIMLQADRKVYVSSGVQIIVIVLNTILTMVGIKIFPSIHFVKLIASLAFIIQPIIYDFYVKKEYSIDLSVAADTSAMKHRWDGFGINLAAFLNGNTDVIVLSVLSTLSNVSIYGVYNLVVMGIKSIITAISAGITPSLGKYYALNDTKSLNSALDKYENIIFYLTFSIYSCAILLIIPFVLNYTSGVHDANYNQPFFSILLILSYGMFCLREPYVNMSYVGNAFKDISKYAYIEAGINIVLSVLFVYYFGINGVALGTLSSMSFRTICQVIYLKKHILFRSPRIFLYKFVAYLIGSICAICFVECLVKTNMIQTWSDWIQKAIVVSVLVFSINGFVVLITRKIGREHE